MSKQSQTVYIVVIDQKVFISKDSLIEYFLRAKDDASNVEYKYVYDQLVKNLLNMTKTNV